jgi:hypothetical protein
VRLDRPPLCADLDTNVWVRTQVVKPRWMTRITSLRCDDDDVLAVADIDQRRRPFGGTLGADVVEQ